MSDYKRMIWKCKFIIVFEIKVYCLITILKGVYFLNIEVGIKEEFGSGVGWTN